MPVERSIQGPGAPGYSARAKSRRPPCSKKRRSISFAMDTVMPPETFPMLFLALWLDALFGYPDWIVRKAGHPVGWIGGLIGAADRHLNKEHRSRLRRKLSGILALICAVACAAG